MQRSKCTHIRIRDDNDYNLDVDALIKSIEKEFNIDFRSLPRWQDLVQRLHVSKTDYKRRVQYANLQKATIIDKLHMQSNRPSPFQLSAELARTAGKWQRMKELKHAKIATKQISEETIDEVAEYPVTEEIGALHPNTENVSSGSESVQALSRVDIGVQYTTPQLVQPFVATNLPIMISTNTHKLISPLNSQTSQLSYYPVPDRTMFLIDTEAEAKEWEPSTTAVICNPTSLIVEHNTLEEQSILFSLTNCTGEYLHIRFKDFTNRSPFNSAKILPNIPKRLYPGIAVVFKLIFKLKNEETFKSGLYFRIGRDVYANTPTEPLFVPVVGTFVENRVVTVSDPVTISPVYPWHIKIDHNSEYPTGILRISVDDPFSYHLHIHKRYVDFSNDPDIFMSMRASTLNTESLEDRDTFVKSETVFPIQSYIQSKSSVKSNLLLKTKSAVKHNIPVHIKPVEIKVQEVNESEEVIIMIVEDIMQLALEAFMFDFTYMYLHPHSKRTINVYFTKAEHIGYHQSYYDLELIDAETETVVMKKTTRVLAEVLANPIEVNPLILDMSNTVLSHGYYEDQFTVTNNHKVFSVTAHIKLTTKMKKLFYVFPMKSVVPPRSSVPFGVKFCSREYLSPVLDDLVHFTFKIVIVGYKTVFHHIPPIFYEIIVPCAAEFKEIYGEKYFKETDESSSV